MDITLKDYHTAKEKIKKFEEMSEDEFDKYFWFAGLRGWIERAEEISNSKGLLNKLFKRRMISWQLYPAQLQIEEAEKRGYSNLPEYTELVNRYNRILK